MTVRVVVETGSTNADMLALAAAGEAEGTWLVAGRQVAGRGREGRAWASPPGNFSGSVLVRLRRTDPPAATLALVAGVAVHEAVDALHQRLDGSTAGMPAVRGAATSGRAADGLRLKWPNDLLLDGAKLAGILLERVGEAVVAGIGANLAHHPTGLDRPATSLAERGTIVAPDAFTDLLVDTFARWLARWRGEGLVPIRAAWLAAAHLPGTALTARLPGGEAIDGLFDGLSPEGALLLRLAGGERRVIHAGDVFLL